MLSRHAENLYWAGRYLERAEDTARMVDVAYHSLLESPPTEARIAWQELLEVLHLAPSYAERYDDVDAVNVVQFLITDRENRSSVLSNVTLARDNLRGVRELVSSETWEAVNSLYLHLRSRDLAAELQSQPYELLASVKRGAQLVSGVANETMPHDDGWRFFTVGRMLERAEMTCRLLSVRIGDVVDMRSVIGFHTGLAILKSASASEAYRRLRRTMDAATVADFLLLTPEFPRAVLYCLRSAEVQLEGLGRAAGTGRARRMLGRLRAGVEYRSVDELIDEGLYEFLEDVQDGIRALSNAVADEFFQYAPAGTQHKVGVT